jgi:hypothetical protein
VDSIDSVFKTFFEILDHSTEYKGYEKIPLEIAVGSVQYDRWAKINGPNIIYENCTIDFLKSHLTDNCRRWYKAKTHNSISNSFIVFTEAAYNQMGNFDKELFQRVDISQCDQEAASFFVTTDLSKVIERGRVFCFLQKIGKTNRSWLRRIDCIFVAPTEYNTILDTLDREKVLFLVGDPEIGKTYTAARILWEYYLKGYKPIWNSGAESPQRELARQKLSEFTADNRSVTYFEDPFGARLYEDNFELSKTILNTIIRARTLDARVIITSREELFKQFKTKINSENDISGLIVALRLMKPSYNDEKMVDILINWAKEFDCSWLKDDSLKTYVLLQANKKLSTPFSMLNFALATTAITDLSKLNTILSEKSKNVSLSFSEEIAHMPREKIIFLSLIAIFLSSVNCQILKNCYRKVSNHYQSQVSFEKMVKEFEMKVSLEKDEASKIEAFRFTHPSYEEAVVNCWNREEIIDLIKEIFRILISEDEPFIKGCCGLTLMKYFQELSFKDYAKKIIFDLLKNKNVETRLGIVLGLEHSFKQIPIATGLEFVGLMLKDKYSLIRLRSLCIVENNFNSIPIQCSKEILCLALGDRAGLVRVEAARYIKMHSESFPDVLVDQAINVNDRLCDRRDLTGYLSRSEDKSFNAYIEARDRIEQIKDKDIKMFLKATYLLAADGCELTGQLESGSASYHRNRKIIYGPRGCDIFCELIDAPQIKLQNQELTTKSSRSLPLKIPVVLFNIKTARQTLDSDENVPIRIIALPLSEQFDPWAKELYDFFKERGKDYIFPFNRQKVWRYVTVNRVFAGLNYRIRKYIYSNKRPISDLPNNFVVFSHQRKLKMSGLRDLRTYELIDKYSFDGADLEIYTSPRDKKNIGNRINKSLSNEDWHRYIYKLCDLK